MTSKDISKLLNPNEFLVFSAKLHELAEDLEDMYWIKKNKNKLSKTSYKDANVLDSVIQGNACIGKPKVSQRISNNR